MSIDVVVQSFLEVGLENITRGRKGFINFGREMLLSRSYELLSPEAVIIELLENVTVDDDVLDACRHLVGRGYRLALDDFVFDGPQNALLPCASVVKLDVIGAGEDETRARADRIAKARNGKVLLLAEKVESREAHHACRNAGCQLFQGYFYSRPELISRSGASVGQLTVIKLMNLLVSDSASDTDIEEAFRRDASLSYKLLRMLSTAAHSGRGIESILHAIRLLGRGTLQRWLSLILVSSFANSGTDVEIVHTAVLRARFCELLGTSVSRGANGDALFLVGLFSLMDCLLKAPMTEVLDRVDLAQSVRDVLLERTGPYAPVLGLVEAYECGAWEEVRKAAVALRVSPGEVSMNYLQAVEWSRESVMMAA